MNTIILLSMLILMFTGFFTGFTIICNNSFWEIVKIDVEEDQDIAVIQNLGSDTIIIAGRIATNGMYRDRDKYQPYISMSFDNGKSWQKKTDFDCNEVDELHYKDGVILVRAFKYPNSTLKCNGCWRSHKATENRPEG